MSISDSQQKQQAARLFCQIAFYTWSLPRNKNNACFAEHPVSTSVKEAQNKQKTTRINVQLNF